mgnify:CR=1 FL=1
MSIDIYSFDTNVKLWPSTKRRQAQKTHRHSKVCFTICCSHCRAIRYDVVRNGSHDSRGLHEALCFYAILSLDFEAWLDAVWCALLGLQYDPMPLPRLKYNRVDRRKFLKRQTNFYDHDWPQDLGRVLLKVVNKNVDVNVDLNVTKKNVHYTCIGLYIIDIQCL